MNGFVGSGSTNSLRLTWSNLTYQINESKWSLKNILEFFQSSESYSVTEKVILQEQSGQLDGGTITALMGPSGAGEQKCLPEKVPETSFSAPKLRAEMFTFEFQFTTTHLLFTFFP